MSEREEALDLVSETRPELLELDRTLAELVRAALKTRMRVKQAGGKLELLEQVLKKELREEADTVRPPPGTGQ